MRGTDLEAASKPEPTYVPETASHGKLRERIIAREGLLAPDEPALREALIEPEDEVGSVAPELLHQRLAWLVEALPLNLRSGRFGS